MYQGLSQELAAVMPTALETGLFTGLCTITQPDGIIGPSGAPSGTFVPVAGLTAIACMDAPPSSARIQATEVKGLAEIMALNLRHILLAGYFPQIFGNTNWRAVVTKADGVTTITYDILGGEADSQTQMSRIEVRTATI